MYHPNQQHIPPSQQQQLQQHNHADNSIPIGYGTNKLHNAVMTMRRAFADIMDHSNYTNTDINDPYVGFALSLYSKYNNDLDFHNTMAFLINSSTIPLQNFTSPHMQSNQLIDYTPAFYLYPNGNTFPFSIFPQFIQLPLHEFTPDLLNDMKEFEKLEFIGASLLKYLIQSTLYNKNPNYDLNNFLTVVKSIMNETSLTILCQAYNLDFNYKFIGLSIPHYRIICAYFGKYYGLYLKYSSKLDSKTFQSSWSSLYIWMENLLGYNEESEKKVNNNNINENQNENKNEKQNENQNEAQREDFSESNNTVTNIQTKKNDSKSGQFTLQELIQSVQQDINQSKTATSEFNYNIAEHADLKTGMFNCILSINNVEVSNLSAMSKKLARSGAALLAAIDKSILKHLKRSYYQYWTDKYIKRCDAIKEKIFLDQRFAYSISENSNNNESTYLSPSLDNSELLNVSSLHGGSPSCVETSISINTESNNNHNDNTDINIADLIPLSTAKEKVYSYYNSKYNIVPKYVFKQLGNSKFEAKLFIEDEMVSFAIATSKKDAGAKAAMQLIEQNSSNFV